MDEKDKLEMNLKYVLKMKKVGNREKAVKNIAKALNRCDKTDDDLKVAITMMEMLL